MKWLLLIAIASLGLWCIHRLLLWMEERGWIYYQKKKASPGTAGSALLEIQRMLEPEKRYVLEALQEDDQEQDDEGAPDSDANLRRGKTG